MASTLTIIGYLIDCDKEEIYLSEKAFAKLVHVLFNEISLDTRTGTSVPVTTMQRLASLVMQAANTMPAMRAYSRSFSYNLRGLRATATHTTWLARSIIDLQHWRNALRNATCDLSWLRIPTNWPPLLAKQRNETHTARSQRQAAAADIVGFADACTNGNGIVPCDASQKHNASDASILQKLLV